MQSDVGIEPGPNSISKNYQTQHEDHNNSAKLMLEDTSLTHDLNNGNKASLTATPRRSERTVNIKSGEFKLVDSSR